MSREYVVLWAGRHQRGPWEEISARYRKRIRRVVPVREVAVKVRRRGEGPERLRAEGEALLAALPDPAWVVALDRRGERLSSEELADRLARVRRDWPHAVAFLLGSDLGLDRAVVEQARLVLSLGPMTFSHELARVVLYEQLYRCASIEVGTGYHRPSP